MGSLLYVNLLGLFYSVRYGSLFFLVMHINLDEILKHIPNRYDSTVYVIITCLLLISAGLTFYRLYIVYNLLSSTKSSMIEAHKNSKTILNLKLSYIPIIGSIFKKKD